MLSTSSTGMTERERRIRRELRDDLPHYAAKCLRIRTKAGGIQPLVLNRPQRYLHERLEEQRSATGRVRALVLKGRQQGCSTYVAARFYHRVTHRRGCRVFILTHESDATENLFGMASRFHEHVPQLVKPVTGRDSVKELDFARLDSGYKVATAGTKATGRSQTIQLFHGSEVAFWPFAETHAAGALQAVADLPDTEIILESTANGIGGFFHERWQEAEAGRSDYVAIFIPWFWSEEYRREPPADWRMIEEEQSYAEVYGLDDAQMAWRRAKIVELKHEWLFRQEYPATAAEAFQSSGADSYVTPALVAKARKVEHDPSGPLVVGVDPARFGEDRTAIVRRRGRKVMGIETHHKLDTMQVAGICRRIIETEKPARMFIDVNGLGGGVVDRLNEMGFGSTIRAINSAESPMRPPPVEGGGPMNRRAEMWMDMADWFADPSGVDIPDDDALHADLTAPGYSFDSHGRLRIEKKEDLKKRGLRSPDLADALALTFAEPVASGAVRVSGPIYWKGAV